MAVLVSFAAITMQHLALLRMVTFLQFIVPLFDCSIRASYLVLPWSTVSTLSSHALADPILVIVQVFEFAVTMLP
jgi:hypothetical protein